MQAAVVFLSRKSLVRDTFVTIFISLKPENPRVSHNTNLHPHHRKGNANSRVGRAILRQPRLRSQRAGGRAIWRLGEGTGGFENDDERRYLLGAFGGFFRQVVVGVVGLGDATEQHRDDACRSQRGHGQPRERVAFIPLTVYQNIARALLLFMLSAAAATASACKPPSRQINITDYSR